MLAGCADAGLFGGQLCDTPQFLYERAAGQCATIISIPAGCLLYFGKRL
jgi:hypothetical protein